MAENELLPALSALPCVELEDERPIIVPQYTDPRTGAVYVHRDLTQMIAPWESESHISPIHANEAFGDVASWAAYVTKHAETAHLTWNRDGLRAVLDWHVDGEPGRCQHIARHPFERSPEWHAWTAFADGHAHPQRQAIEFLEEHGEDITDPKETDLIPLLSNLRAGVSARATSELQPDGSTSVSFAQEKTVNAGKTTLLPAVITIAIPVLVGHPDTWKLKVRLRTSIGDDAKLALRFTLLSPQRAEEEAFADRVQAAKDALGDSFTLLRGA